MGTSARPRLRDPRFGIITVVTFRKSLVCEQAREFMCIQDSTVYESLGPYSRING